MPTPGCFVVLRLWEDSHTHLLVRRINQEFGSVTHTKHACEFQCPPDVAKVQEFLGGVKKAYPSIGISFQNCSAFVS